MENNERRTAAKHNRIHLYSPTAACLCVSAAAMPSITKTHTQGTVWEGGQVQPQLYMIELNLLFFFSMSASN